MSKELQQAVKERQVWLMKRKEVLKTLSVSSATLHRGMNEGRFPKAYSLGDGSTRVAWKSNEIQDYIDSLAHSEPVPVAPGCQGRKALLPKVRV